MNALEFAGACANAIENAAAACADQPAGERRRIAVRIVSEPRLALEVENTCRGTAPLNAEGLPEPQRPGHGVGVRSIAAFAERHGALPRACSACASSCPKTSQVGVVPILDTERSAQPPGFARDDNGSAA